MLDREDTRSEPELSLDALRLFHNRELVNVGLLDMDGRIDRSEAERSLTEIAEVCVEFGLSLAEAEVTRRAKRRPAWLRKGEFLVVGMGKVASREITYGSDLDVIFSTTSTTPTRGPNYWRRVPSPASPRSSFGRCKPGPMKASATRLTPACVRPETRGCWSPISTPSSRTMRKPRRAGNVRRCCARVRWRARRVWRRPSNASARRSSSNRIRPSCARSCIGYACVWSRKSRASRMRAGLQDRSRWPARYRDDRAVPATGERVADSGLIDVRTVAEQIAMLAKKELLSQGDAEMLASGWEFLQGLSSRLRIVESRSISDLDVERGDLDEVARRLGYRASGRSSGARRALLDEYARRTARSGGLRAGVGGRWTDCGARAARSGAGQASGQASAGTAAAASCARRGPQEAQTIGWGKEYGEWECSASGWRNVLFPSPDRGGQFALAYAGGAPVLCR